MAFTALAGAADQQSSRPNIVLVVADDLGYGELGCQGNNSIPTPHIDSIAEDGIRFTAGYVTAPYCSASRAGLMTGRYPSRFGYEVNPVGARNADPDVGLPPAEITIAEHLHAAGYATGLVGKWHLGGTAKYHPLRQGFDEFFGFLHEGHFYVPPPYTGVTTMLRRRTLPDGEKGRWMRADERLILSTHLRSNEPPYDADNPILRSGQPVIETTYLTDAFTREAVDFIRRHRERPFFLCVAYNAVHSPLQASQEYMEKFRYIEDVQRRIFAAMLANLDDGVGAILRALRETEQEENTLVIFLSDNGGPTAELTSSNAPLRGGKGSVYEGGVRVPFLMQWPGHLPAGRVEDRPVSALDIYATAAAVADAPLPRVRPFDGVDLLPYLSGERTGRPHETLFWRLRWKTAVRVGDWKLLRDSAGAEDSQWELYHLSADRSETKNLAGSQPEKLQELKSVWMRLDAEMASPHDDPR